MFTEFLYTAFPEPLRQAFSFAFSLAPFWLPVLLGVAWYRLWFTYVRLRAFANEEHVLLEIKLPPRVAKTPLAMENVIAGLHFGTDGTFLDRFLKGKTRPWWSLELVSLEGKVHFFIWTRKFLQKLVENHLYAQYPDIEVTPVPDYTRAIPFDLNTYNIWGCDFTLTQPSPIPIKTYVDYGLDKAQKPEEQTDPLAHVLEYLASAGPGEYVWLQILIRPNKAEKPVPGSFFRYMNWKEEARLLVKQIRSNPEDVDISSDGTVTRRLSDGQKELIRAIERAIAKLGFDTGIRGIYLAKRDAFNPTMIPGLVSVFRQFSSETLNGLVPTRYLTKYDYPWQDFREMRQNKDRFRVFDAFRRRSWFYEPYKTPHFVMNTEELATLYHIPSEGVQTPHLPRVPSVREGAPANLPV